MYFYLFEPNARGKEGKMRRAHALINLHGIAGEVATPSPKEPLEDLVTRAADKGYNTIVAVGGDSFITAVAKLLTKSDIAFGAIPIAASSTMQTLLGVEGIEQAVLSLKQRKVIDTGVGVIAPGKLFLLDATVTPPRSTSVVIESKTFRVEGAFTQLTIERRDIVTVRFSDRALGPSPAKHFFRWLVGRRTDDPTETVLRGSTLNITTPEPLPILVHGEQIAKTPCKVRVVPNALKLIQARVIVPGNL